MSLYNETIDIMKKYGIYANKKLGQNFLIDENVIENIIKSSNVTKNDIIIEIGPGLGTLTKSLIEKAGYVICIELDERMIKILNDRFKVDNFEIINDDVLKVDLKELIKEKKMQTKLKNVKVVANLPYYITTPIIMKLLEENLEIESITVMVQKEVALRLSEEPGRKNTGAITYAISYYSKPQIVLEVPNTCFKPEPEVTSAVIKLEILNKPQIMVKNEKQLFNIIKIAFMQKRKTLVNSLVNGNIFKTKEEAENCLDILGIDKKIRPENLSLEQFGKIADYIEK